MDNNSDERFTIIQSTIEPKNRYMKANKQNSNEKMRNITEAFKAILKSTITTIMDQINTYKSSLDHMDSSKPQYPITVVPDKNRASPLDIGHSTKIGGMWTLKHDNSSPKLYEVLIKTELKGYTVLDLKKFYNHINICINDVTRLQEDLLPAYQSIKICSKFS